MTFKLTLKEKNKLRLEGCVEAGRAKNGSKRVPEKKSIKVPESGNSFICSRNWKKASVAGQKNGRR